MLGVKIDSLLCRAVVGFVCALGIAGPSAANAALVDNGIYTTDTATGLDWLDLTETRGISYDNVLSQLGDGQQFQGWRFASKLDITQFWLNAGGTGPFTGPAAGRVDWVGELQSLWGRTYPFVYVVNGKVVQGTVAMTSDTSITCAACNLTVYLLNNIDDSQSSLGDYAEALQLNEAYRWQGQIPIGMALIRGNASAIPEPETYALMLAGLGAICVIRFRRKPKK